MRATPDGIQPRTDRASPAFGVVLRRLRLAAELSQEQLAERARISLQAVPRRLANVTILRCSSSETSFRPSKIKTKATLLKDECDELFVVQVSTFFELAVNHLFRFLN